MRKREIKITVPFRSYATCDRKFQKKIARKFKKLKNDIMTTFQAKIRRKNLRKIENNNYGFIPFLPDA